MNIIIDPHTLERAKERGANKNEIEDVIRNGFTYAAKYGKKAKAKIYNYKQERLGKYYEEKRVEVIYTIENEVIITVTVYVYYGKWEENK